MTLTHRSTSPTRRAAACPQLKSASSQPNRRGFRPPLTPDTVVPRPLAEDVEMVTTAAAWTATSANPAVLAAIEVLSSTSGGADPNKVKRDTRCVALEMRLP